jgi:hypothetical protein
MHPSLSVKGSIQSSTIARRAAIGLLVLQGVGAVGGGSALMLGPQGQIIPLPVSQLAGSPFDSYFVPGLVLFTVLGIGPLAVALLAWRRHALSPVLTMLVGVALLIWIGVQVATIGYSTDPMPLQAVYLGLGVILLLMGLWWLRLEQRS